MADHPIGDIMQTTMENIKEMIDVNTIAVSYTHLDVYKRQI